LCEPRPSDGASQTVQAPAKRVDEAQKVMDELVAHKDAPVAVVPHTACAAAAPDELDTADLVRPSLGSIDRGVSSLRDVRQRRLSAQDLARSSRCSSAYAAPVAAPDTAARPLETDNLPPRAAHLEPAAAVQPDEASVPAPAINDELTAGDDELPRMESNDVGVDSMRKTQHARAAAQEAARVARLSGAYAAPITASDAIVLPPQICPLSPHNTPTVAAAQPDEPSPSAAAAAPGLAVPSAAACAENHFELPVKGAHQIPEVTRITTDQQSQDAALPPCSKPPQKASPAAKSPGLCTSPVPLGWPPATAGDVAAVQPEPPPACSTRQSTVKIRI